MLGHVFAFFNLSFHLLLWLQLKLTCKRLAQLVRAVASMAIYEAIRSRSNIAVADQQQNRA